MEFCSPPTEAYTVLNRVHAKNEEVPELADPLKITSHSFNQQYANMYYVRLLQLKQAILKNAEDRWGSLPERPRYSPKILDVQLGDLCYMVGTVYIEMDNKPNVMHHLDEEDAIVNPHTPVKYISDKNVISLEDESGRVELCGSGIANPFLVTGTIIGVLGKETSSGGFEVIDICLAGLPPQDPCPPIVSKQPKYLALLSGLHVGGSDELDMKTELLVEFLSGELGSSKDQISSACITRVIIGGNSLAKNCKLVDTMAPKKYGYDSASFDASPMMQLDSILEDMCNTVDVDIMAGPSDPAQLHLPQQPMYPSMFNKAHKLSTFHSVTNPYWTKVEDRLILGTSGQNIDDIYRYVESDDRLKMAEATVHWRHMAPTAPDTLWCYPFQDRDPFVMDKCPHIYFIGNQPQFEDRLVKGPHGQEIRVVLVPSFAETGILVLINLNNLDCTAIEFSDKDIKAIPNESHLMDEDS
ncbi:DNA polymerase alpha/epsilon subunit B-domain-containing protein [Pilobolus umbonatus]|nr:DNA polymerase alpha/epsilon subunit B-domain-containing protein [Pilobolus umbonatus]